MKKDRIQSIDLLRGIVMVIMALDHVRDFFHADAFLFDPADLSSTTPLIFFTRFITHYCAPVFVFLSGTSAFFISQRKTKNELSLFLFKRGLWLIFIEVSLVSFGWSFNPARAYTALQVIWAIGFSMLVLSVLVQLRMKYILAIGIILVFGHNLLDGIETENRLFILLHIRKMIQFGGINILVAYPLIPWIGLMAIGYCTGNLYSKTFEKAYRKKLLNILGLTSIILFFILRWSNLYGDLFIWTYQSSPLFTFLSLLNVTKYPPSLLYILITIGPSLIFLANAEKIKGKFADILIVYGRVPFFYYLLHLYVIHLFAMVAAETQGFGWDSMVLNNFVSRSPHLIGYGFSLSATYLIWIGIVALLFPLCNWYNNYKTNHPEKWWLSYL